MAESTHMLMREFLSWVADRPRTYEDAMEAWQSHCPRQTIWEDAIADGYIQTVSDSAHHSAAVVLTPRGQQWLQSNNNHH